MTVIHIIFWYMTGQTAWRSCIKNTFIIGTWFSATKKGFPAWTYSVVTMSRNIKCFLKNHSLEVGRVCLFSIITSSYFDNNSPS